MPLNTGRRTPRSPPAHDPAGADPCAPGSRPFGPACQWQLKTAHFGVAGRAVAGVSACRSAGRPRAARSERSERSRARGLVIPGSLRGGSRSGSAAGPGVRATGPPPGGFSASARGSRWCGSDRIRTRSSTTARGFSADPASSARSGGFPGAGAGGLSALPRVRDAARGLRRQRRGVTPYGARLESATGAPTGSPSRRWCWGARDGTAGTLRGPRPGCRYVPASTGSA